MIEIETTAILEHYNGFEIRLKHNSLGFDVIASNYRYGLPVENRHYIHEHVYPHGFLKRHVDDDDIKRKISEVKAAIDTIQDKEQELYDRVKRLTGETKCQK